MNPSASLTSITPWLVASLRNAIMHEMNYPSRTILYKRLKAVEIAANLLVKELADEKLLNLLLEGESWLENGNEARHALQDIRNRAAKVRERQPPSRGRGKLYPGTASGPTAKEYCALIVSVVWNRERNVWPGKSDKEAHKACEALWRAAEGPKRAQAGGSQVGATGL